MPKPDKKKASKSQPDQKSGEINFIKLISNLIGPTDLTNTSKDKEYAAMKAEILSDIDSRLRFMTEEQTGPHPKTIVEALLKDHIAPYLKSQGFKRKATTHFWREQNGVTHVISMIRDRYNSAWECRFCFGIGVYDKDIQEAWGVTVPSMPPDTRDCFFNSRFSPIKYEIEVNEDTWWAVRSDTRLETLSLQIVKSLEMVLPWFSQCADPARRMSLLPPDRKKFLTDYLKKRNRSRR